jgi:exosome complex component RRP45
MEKVLRRSEAVDRESLCILAGQRVRLFLLLFPLPFLSHAPNDGNIFIQVWSIKLTLHFLSDSGNMLDCACLAGIAALRHFRKPDVEVVGDEVIVVRFLLLLRLRVETE